jgi:hypothetical protein
MALTPNEATILAGVVGGLSGAVIGGAVSVFTTRYIMKHGPNYSSQIDQVNSTLDERIAGVSSSLDGRISDINATLEALTQAHTQHFEQQASFQREEVARTTSRLWKPDARIEVTTDATGLLNHFVLKSEQEFSLLNVFVQTKDGATLAALPITKGISSTGFRVPIEHATLLKVKQSANLGGLRNGARGQFAYKVRRGEQMSEFLLPFTTEDLMVNSTIYIKLIG